MIYEDLALDEDFYEKCSFFTKEILRWNKIHNLTGAKTQKEVWENIYDSIYPIKFLPDIKTVLDIGTGAGFPGLILAFAHKKSSFLLVEPRNKRAAFLNFIISSLELKNVKVEKKRIQKIKPKPFDLITSRAVDKTFNLLKLCKPFVKKDTLLLFYKGTEVEKELDVVKNCDFNIIKKDKRRYLLIKGSKCF